MDTNKISFVLLFFGGEACHVAGHVFVNCYASNSKEEVTAQLKSAMRAQNDHLY